MVLACQCVLPYPNIKVHCTTTCVFDSAFYYLFSNVTPSYFRHCRSQSLIVCGIERRQWHAGGGVASSEGLSNRLFQSTKLFCIGSSSQYRCLVQRWYPSTQQQHMLHAVGMGTCTCNIFSLSLCCNLIGNSSSSGPF